MRPEIPKHRFRITVRGNNAELRGRATLNLDRLNDLARAIQAFGWMVVASPLGEGDLDTIAQSERMKRALEVIGRDGCDRYTAVSGETCRTDGTRTIDAEYTADQWCSACIAAWGQEDSDG
jgi:hypothetical protein